jgi:prepilin-type N-terminal cleavage/methylation domain-containing protein
MPRGLSTHDSISSRGHRNGGFTLLEVAIALSVLAVLLIGVLPLFAQAMSNNVQGNELTEVTNRARTHIERLMAAPYDSALLTLPDGEEELRTIELWSSAEDRWLEEASFPVNQLPLYSRITRVRQFNLSAVNSFDLEFENDEALPGGTSASLANIKEIEVRVNSGPPTTSGPLGRGKSVSLRVLKSF